MRYMVPSPLAATVNYRMLPLTKAKWHNTACLCTATAYFELLLADTSVLALTSSMVSAASMLQLLMGLLLEQVPVLNNDHHKHAQQ